MPYLVPDKLQEPLYAIVPYHNPWRWKSREKHTIRAIKHFMDSGAVVVLVEAAFNRRALAFADSGLDGTPVTCPVLGANHGLKHMHIGLRASSELWLKENMINVAISRLPYDWKQVCWLDSDVMFMRPNWVGECIHKLQHYSFLQMFSHARDLGPNYEMLPEDYPHANGVSFIQSWKDGDLTENLAFHRPLLPANIQADIKKIKKDFRTLRQDFKQLEKDLEGDYYYQPGGLRRVWSGLAWAATREAFDLMGGLIDFAVWGGGDWHMAHALVGKRDGLMHSGLHQNYKTMVNEWFDRSQRFVRQNLGVMEGSIVHSWHGRKTSRGYGDKHRILAKLGFDPLRHLKRDYQGLYQLHDDGADSFMGLRDSFRKVAKERNEDSIDI